MTPEKLEELGVRCQWYTRKGPRCSRYGNNWRLNHGRYCDQHAKIVWGRLASLW